MQVSLKGKMKKDNHNRKKKMNAGTIITLALSPSIHHFVLFFVDIHDCSPHRKKKKVYQLNAHISSHHQQMFTSPLHKISHADTQMYSLKRIRGTQAHQVSKVTGTGCKPQNKSLMMGKAEKSE